MGRWCSVLSRVFICIVRVVSFWSFLIFCRWVFIDVRVVVLIIGFFVVVKGFKKEICGVGLGVFGGFLCWFMLMLMWGWINWVLFYRWFIEKVGVFGWWILLMIGNVVVVFGFLCGFGVKVYWVLNLGCMLFFVISGFDVFLLLFWVLWFLLFLELMLMFV